MKNSGIYKALAVLLFLPFAGFGEEYRVYSPNGQIKAEIELGKHIIWAVYKNNESLIEPSRMAMSISGNREFGVDPEVISTSERMVREQIKPVVPVKNRYIKDHYNELVISFKENYDLIFRAYNDGVAYRFKLRMPQREQIEIISETVEFNFSSNHRLFWPRETHPTFQSHYECTYYDIHLNELTDEEYGSLPVLLETNKGTKILLTEADLYDYPNLFLFGEGTNALQAKFPKAILEVLKVGDRGEEIVRKAPYIAKTTGQRSFPWRVVIIATEDKQLLENEMVYKLSSPNKIADTDWIRPGKVAWDWWNANNVYGVNFRAGINTKTYKYYIDFASEYGLEYIILDEGWSVTTTDLTKSIPEIDLPELFRYAEEKDTGIILWVLWNALDEDIEGTLDRFASWGAKGIKVDFMARADQAMVNYYERVAKAAAERKLLVNFHGSYKPSGLNRKYPNVLSYEGVKGLEWHKWSEDITPEHNVILPFIRMVAGPMDYTPGAMINAGKDNFCIRFTEPMSQGTRAHQAAMYVMYESPMQMLADNPSNYLREPEYTRFIAQIPVIWDQTIGLESAIGQYAAVARKKGERWYIAAMTNWEGRELVITPDFLDQKSYRVEYIKDGINADRYGADYKMGSIVLSPNESITITMANGGGWVAILTPVE